MKAVYTELHRSHDPQFFLVRGVVQRTTEQPERADRLLGGAQGRQARSGCADARSGRARAPGFTVRNISAFSPRPGTPGPRSGDAGPRDDRQHASGAQCRDLSDPHRRPSRLAHGRYGLSDRARHLGCGLRGHGCGDDGGATRAGRRGRDLCALPSARPSRLSRSGRRLLLPQQQRDRSGASAPEA